MLSDCHVRPSDSLLGTSNEISLYSSLNPLVPDVSRQELSFSNLGILCQRDGQRWFVCKGAFPCYVDALQTQSYKVIKKQRGVEDDTRQKGGRERRARRGRGEGGGEVKGQGKRRGGGGVDRRRPSF